MDVIDLLMHDHRVMEKLFSQLTRATGAERKRLFEALYSVIVLHATAEVRFVYPALIRQIPDQVERALQQHNEAIVKLDILRTMDPDSETFAYLLATLRRDMQTHIRAEEQPSGLLESARQVFAKGRPDRIEENVDEFKAARMGT